MAYFQRTYFLCGTRFRTRSSLRSLSAVLSVLGMLVCVTACVTVSLGQAKDSLLNLRTAPFNAREPVYFQARSTSYQAQGRLLVAQGPIHLTQGDRHIDADSMVYDFLKGEGRLLGNVTIKDPGVGEVKTQEVIFTLEPQQWRTCALAATLTDSSHLWASAMRYWPHHKGVFEEGVFTPCPICEGSAPAWSLKAERIIRDEQDESVTYENVSFVVKNVPLFSVPSFTMPLTRRSGILMPFVRGSTSIGMGLGIPFYWAINPQHDLMVAPMFTSKRRTKSKGGALVLMNYRGAFAKGMITADGSLSLKSSRPAVETPGYKVPKTRSHAEVKADFHLNEYWRMKGNFIQVSDKSYTRSHPFLRDNSDPILLSHATVERFEERSYLRFMGLRYEGLRLEDRQRLTPVVGPYGVFLNSVPLRSFPGEWQIHAQGGMITRKLGLRMHKIVVHQALVTRWRHPQQGWGVHTKGLLRTAAYHTQTPLLKGEAFTPTFQTVAREVTYRNHGVLQVFPQASVMLDWPWRYAPTQTIVTPKIQGVFGPRVKQDMKWFPPEDAKGFELTDSNLFSSQMFPGVDRWDDINRMTYGLSIYQPFDQQSVEFFIGQSYLLSTPAQDLALFGLSKGTSDVVGRLTYQWDGWLIWQQRARWRPSKKYRGKAALGIMFHETTLELGPSWCRGSVGHLYAAQANRGTMAKVIKTVPLGNAIHQVSLGLTLKPLETWTVRAATAYNLILEKAKNEKGIKKRRRPISLSLGIEYAHECFSIGIDVVKDYTKVADVKRPLSYGFVISLKTLGSIGSKQMKPLSSW